MDWFKAIPTKWRVITAAAFGVCWIGMYRLGKETGRDKAIGACAEQAQGHDYTWRTCSSVREEFEIWS